jgi:hypothetical protein
MKFAALALLALSSAIIAGAIRIPAAPAPSSGAAFAATTAKIPTPVVDRAPATVRHRAEVASREQNAGRLASWLAENPVAAEKLLELAERRAQ